MNNVIRVMCVDVQHPKFVCITYRMKRDLVKSHN